ncbi:MAG TPA: hypothetical protein PK129_08335 [Cellvibrionaceae bacterium]|nr:hypothetical protein [Cellvibrionaceae bacterium]
MKKSFLRLAFAALISQSSCAVTDSWVGVAPIIDSEGVEYLVRVGEENEKFNILLCKKNDCQKFYTSVSPCLSLFVHGDGERISILWGSINRYTVTIFYLKERKLHLMLEEDIVGYPEYIAGNDGEYYVALTSKVFEGARVRYFSSLYEPTKDGYSRVAQVPFDDRFKYWDLKIHKKN